MFRAVAEPTYRPARCRLRVPSTMMRGRRPDSGRALNVARRLFPVLRSSAQHRSFASSLTRSSMPRQPLELTSRCPACLDPDADRVHRSSRSLGEWCQAKGGRGPAVAASAKVLARPRWLLPFAQQRRAGGCGEQALAKRASKLEDRRSRRRRHQATRAVHSLCDTGLVQCQPLDSTAHSV